MSGPEVISLSDLNGLNGFQLAGIDVGDRSGVSVSSAGDVNGDGYDDIIVGAPYARQHSKSDVGESYVVFGSAAGFPAVLSAAWLNGANGFRLTGIGAKDFAGYAVSTAGDLNGDGFDDIAIGAYGGDPDGILSAGETYVLFGSDEPFPFSMSLGDLDGNNGFRIDGGHIGDLSGRSVSSAGDVNGDGLDDLVIGAYGADANGLENSGESYVVFGSTTGFSATLSSSDLNGMNGFRLAGSTAGAFVGASVSSAGDVNGDGFDDVVISGQAGSYHVVFGSNAGFSADLSIADLNGVNGFRLEALPSGGSVQRTVSSAGDLNGDGFDDLIVGAARADGAITRDAGRSFVLFGAAGGFTAVVSQADLDGDRGFVLEGGHAEDLSGISVSAAGDVNGDGLDDLIVGAPGADPGGRVNAGESYLVYGSRDRFPDTLSLTDLDGSNGFRLGGIDTGDASGNAVSAAGDVNGDGFDDLIVGAPSAQRGLGEYLVGEAYIIFGAATGFVVPNAVGTEGDDWLGLPGNWRDGLNWIDGLAGTDMMSFAGVDAWIYVNLATGQAASYQTGTPFNLVMRGIENVTGTGYADTFVGGEDAEWIRGLGGNDTIYARGMAADRYDGGSGADTLSFVYASSGVAVSLLRGTGYSGEARGDRVQGVEHLTGSFHDDIIWGDHGANKLLGGAGDDTLIGNGGDDYLLGGFGQDVVLYAGNQSDYEIRQDGAATWVTDLAGAAGTDLIGQVEILRFADGDLML